jgi:hypothetical protein
MISLGQKWLEVKANIPILSTAEVKKCGAVQYTPIRLEGLQLEQFSTDVVIHLQQS